MIIEATLQDIQNSYDWAEVFGEGLGGNTDQAVNDAPPGCGVSVTPPLREDIADVLASVNGENGEAEWLALVKMKNGRYIVTAGSCDYTGWDCMGGNSLSASNTLADALQFGLSFAQKERLGIEA